MLWSTVVIIVYTIIGLSSKPSVWMVRPAVRTIQIL